MLDRVGLRFRLLCILSVIQYCSEISGLTVDWASVVDLNQVHRRVRFAAAAAAAAADFGSQKVQVVVVVVVADPLYYRKGLPAVAVVAGCRKGLSAAALLYYRKILQIAVGAAVDFAYCQIVLLLAADSVCSQKRLQKPELAHCQRDLQPVLPTMQAVLES